MIRAFSFVLLSIATIATWAQRTPLLQLRHFVPQDGLSNRHVTALLQDDIGFVWVGSVSGLDRFDGHSFRNWSVSDGLRGARVDILRHDAEGMVWVFSTLANGDIATIDLIDPLAGTLYPMEQGIKSTPFSVVDMVRVGPQRMDGTLVFGLASPARCAIYRRDGQFTVIPMDGLRFEPLGDDGVGNVIGHLVGRDGAQRIVRLDPGGETTEIQALPSGTLVECLISGRTTPGALYSIRRPQKNHQYFDTYSELILAQDRRTSGSGDPVHKPINFTPLPQRQWRLEDTRLLAADGRVIFDLIEEHPEVGQSLKDCLVDRSGNPWIATEFGLFRIEVRGDLFERYLYTEDIPEGYGVLCRGMDWHGDRLYLSTEWEGAAVITPGSDTLRIEVRPTPQYLFATHVATDGTWWRGGPELMTSETSGGSERTYVVPDKVWSILSDVEGGVLFGGLQGVHWLDAGSGAVEHWKDARYPELDRAHVLQLVRTNGGGVLATTSKGIYLLGAGGKVKKRWWSGAEPPDRLPYEDLHHCYTDADGIMWLSTRGSGMIRFDPASGKYQQYSMRNGFPNNMVYAVYEDAHGQLWLPTDGGIVRFDKRTRQSTVFTTVDGLSHDEFNRLAHCQAPDGRLFFGGLNGITAFDPEVIRRSGSQTIPPLVFTGLMRYSPEQAGMVDRTNEITRGGDIELGEEDRSIEVSFALLSFEGDGRIVYAWRLDGDDEEWSYQHGSRIRLDRLPYGTHKLQVKARDAMGQWSQHVLEMSFTVHTPWFASRWVWLGAGAAAASACLLLLLMLHRAVLGRRRMDAVVA